MHACMHESLPPVIHTCTLMKITMFSIKTLPNLKLTTVNIGYVLMERIFPSLQNTAFLRNGEIEIHPSISELGIYGTFIGSGLGLGFDSRRGFQKKGEGVLLNEYAGYLLRTKPDGVDEGGVATGYSVLNSIVLTDTQADSK